MSERRRREIMWLGLGLVAFAVGASAFGASKYQNGGGGTWLHAFWATVPITLAMSAVVAVGIVVGTRPRGDGMRRHGVVPDAPDRAPIPRGPEVLGPSGSAWPPPPVPAQDLAQPAAGRIAVDEPATTYAVRSGGLVAQGIFFGAGLLSAPIFLVAALRDAPGPSLLVVLWIVGMAFAFRWWLRSPARFELGATSLAIHPIRGDDRVIALADLTEIRWPTSGGFVTLRHRDGVVHVPKATCDLQDLVVELRRRNPAIAFDGVWPPRVRLGARS